MKSSYGEDTTAFMGANSEAQFHEQTEHGHGNEKGGLPHSPTGGGSYSLLYLGHPDRIWALMAPQLGVVLVAAAAAFHAPVRQAGGARSVFDRSAAAGIACDASRAARRQRHKAARDLAVAMVQLKIPGNAATRYAEVLAGRGIGTMEELATLSPALLDACEMRSAHRQVLRASRVMLAVEAQTATAPAAAASATPSQTAAVEIGVKRQDAADADADADPDADDDATQSFTVGSQLAGARLDAALASALPPLSRSYFSALCADGDVRVDGAVVIKKSAKLAVGQLVQARLRAAAELVRTLGSNTGLAGVPGGLALTGLPFELLCGQTVVPEPIALDVLHEDDWLIAINKPSGMVVHPAPGHWNGTFANALAYRVAAAATATAPAPAPAAVAGTLPDVLGDGLRPGVVHRLDRYTTGVLLGAKTVDAQRRLLDAFASRTVFKL